MLARGPDAVLQARRLANKFAPTQTCRIANKFAPTFGAVAQPGAFEVGGNLLARKADAVLQTCRIANKFAPTFWRGGSAWRFRGRRQLVGERG
ncbi:hypothetical protein AO242_05540 [Pseudomonas sp. ICMP 561]|nr:hypothetical protein AO242_05540 [Pseudomonas sp. ICMP 561]